MTDRWVISDTHFGHRNIVNFTNNDGTPLRPWDDIQEHDEALIKNWNEVVKPNDVVYHLGDVVINRKALASIMPRLNGKKRLIRGNHDVFKTKDYMQYFDEIYGVKVGTDIYKEWNFIMSHIPIHRESMSRWKANLHGHLHGNKVMDPKWPSVEDPFYMSMCVEHIDYTPKHMDSVLEDIRQR
jgi:calcineurin-like phosphoesterase family protein